MTESRCTRLARHIIENGCTVREAAAWYGISKSTVHKDVTDRLKGENPGLYAEVKEIQAAADAEVAKIKAAAEAEAKKLAADAEKYAGEKEAEANKALAESLTEALIKYYEALGWDGKLPETVVSGTDTILPVLGGVGGGEN